MREKLVLNLVLQSQIRTNQELAFRKSTSMNKRHQIQQTNINSKLQRATEMGWERGSSGGGNGKRQGAGGLIKNATKES